MKKTIALLIALTLVLTACESNRLYASPQEIYDYIEASAEPKLPLMLDIAEGRLPDYKVNIEDVKSFVAKEAAISAVFVQLIIIEAQKGKVNDVYNAMLEHQSKLKEAAFYPQAQKAAANSIAGVEGDLVYLICYEDAKNIENELLVFLGD